MASLGRALATHLVLQFQFSALRSVSFVSLKVILFGLKSDTLIIAVMAMSLIITYIRRIIMLFKGFSLLGPQWLLELSRLVS